MIGIKKIAFCTVCLKHGIFGWGSGREMNHEMILQQYPRGWGLEERCCTSWAWGVGKWETGDPPEELLLLWGLAQKHLPLHWGSCTLGWNSRAGGFMPAWEVICTWLHQACHKAMNKVSRSWVLSRAEKELWLSPALALNRPLRRSWSQQ